VKNKKQMMNRWGTFGRSFSVACLMMALFLDNVDIRSSQLARTANEVVPRQLIEASSAGAGETVWAKNFEGKLIAGMDGALYEPYRASTIESIQAALRTRGLYNGPLNGILDRPTMKAIYEFQQATYSLQVCGVPTPRTRMILTRGSHTDTH